MIDDEARAALAAAWRAETYEAGDLIIDADLSNQDVAFILSGEARAAVYNLHGRQVTFVEVEPGECVGEFSALDGAPRSANVEARARCEVAKLSRARFEQTLLDHPKIALALLRVLVGKLRRMSTRLEEMSSLRLDQRVRLEILRLAKRHQTGPDHAEIANPPTQLDLSTQVISNRESVAKEMGRMRDQGLIERHGRALFIPSISRLAAAVTAG
ncbi:MAG: Crp/Fnr family transcriptional regulator [Pseudomonadota bacterium]